MTHSQLAAEYSQRQTGFQAALEKLREQTTATVRLRLEIEAADYPTRPDIDAHREAQAVLKAMHKQVEDLRAERDRFWRQLHG